MNRRQVGIAVLVFVLLLHLLAPGAWAQSTASTGPEEVTGSHRTAAGFANVVYVPAKVVTCIVGGGSWLAVLVLSGGTAYNTATNVVSAACGGNWVVQAEDIKFRSSDPYGASAR